MNMLPEKSTHLNLQLLPVMNIELCIQCLLFNLFIVFPCNNVYSLLNICIFLCLFISSTLHQELGKAERNMLNEQAVSWV
jgi:hypothetical protein